MGRLYWRRSAGRGRVSAAVSKPNGSGFGYGPPPVRVTPPVFACCVPHGPILRYSDVRYRDSTEADTSHPSAVSAPLVNTGVSQRPLPGISEANTGVSDLRVTFVFSDDLSPSRTLRLSGKSGSEWAERVPSGWGGSRAPGGHAAGAWGSGATYASSLGGFGHLHGRGGQRQRGRASRETVLEGWAADGGASHAMPPPYAPPHAS